MIESIDDLIVFLKHFHRNLLEDPSLPPEQIPKDLPDGLAKIYRELGGLINLSQHPHPFGTQDRFVHVGQLQRVDGMIEFCWENQGVWSVRCPSNEKNPPVYSDYSESWNNWNVEEDFVVEEGFVVACESLNNFLITFCLKEAAYSCRNSAIVYNANNIFETIIGAVKFQPLWLDGKYVHNFCLNNFYISEDRDILMLNNRIFSKTSPLVDIFDPSIDPKIKVRMFGIDLPRRYWTSFSNWQAEWLLDEENASIRRTLIEQLGYEKICDKLGAISIDSWQEYTLLKIDIGKEPMRLLKMTCPSTAQIHVLRVLPDMTSAEAAITWVNHGIHPSKFSVQT